MAQAGRLRLLRDYDADVTWTFSSEREMKTAEDRGGVGHDAGWNWWTSDQHTSVALSIGLYNATEAEFETGGMKGLWGRSRLRPPSTKAQINNRHVLSSDAVAKAGKTQSVTLAAKSTLDSDLALLMQDIIQKPKKVILTLTGMYMV